MPSEEQRRAADWLIRRLVKATASKLRGERDAAPSRSMQTTEQPKDPVENGTPFSDRPCHDGDASQ